MSDDTRRHSDTQRPSDEAALSARLRRLGDRLDLERASKASSSSSGGLSSTDRTAMARGLRLSSELVAGVLVGAGIGWLIDRWLGISPWGIIVFLLLGFVEGIHDPLPIVGPLVLGHAMD